MEKDTVMWPKLANIKEEAAAVATYGSEEHAKIPGTVVLVAVFFVSFVLYYFINWKYLAEVWPLR